MDNLCCLDCDGYALWDGDYCCTLKMQILSYGEEKTHRALNPENVLKAPCIEYRHDGTEKHYHMNHEIWNNCNKL